MHLVATLSLHVDLHNDNSSTNVVGDSSAQQMVHNCPAQAALAPAAVVAPSCDHVQLCRPQLDGQKMLLQPPQSAWVLRCPSQHPNCTR